jgi:hypothetical protein
MNESLQRVDSCSQAWIGYKVHMPFPSWPRWGQEQKPLLLPHIDPKIGTATALDLTRLPATERLKNNCPINWSWPWTTDSSTVLESWKRGPGPRIIHETHSHYSLHIAAATHVVTYTATAIFFPGIVSPEDTHSDSHLVALFISCTTKLLVLVLFLGRHRGFAMNWSIECPC